MATKRKSSKEAAGKSKTTGDDALDLVLRDFKASWEYTNGSWHSRWQDNYALYNNNRVKRGYEGITDTFVPMTFSTIETMTSALFGTKPKFNFSPPSDKPDQKTDILNGLLDYYWERDQWNIKVISWGRSFLMLGTSIVYLYWEGDHPCMINIPIRDFFIDPTASTLYSARYMGRRFLTTVEDLESFEVIDPETEEMRPKYKNLKSIQVDGEKGDPTDKQEKDMFYGSTVSQPEAKQVEVIEYWTSERVVSIANRTTVIEDTENYYMAKARANGDEYPKGIMPFACLRDYVDESLFYAKGEVDFIFDEQELLNDITNQNVDAVLFLLNPMAWLDPKYAHLQNEIENIPGAVIPAPKDAYGRVDMGTIPTDAFAERQNLKNEMRETTASNEIVKGVGQETKTTATEVNAQIAGAGQRMGLKVTQIENEGFHYVAKIVFEMVKLYVTEPMMVRIIGKDGARWEEFDPGEFQGDYEPRVQLDITIENQKQEDAAMAKEMLAAFLNDPDVNQQELKKLVLAKAFRLDPDEVQGLMLDPMAGQGPPGMGGMPPPEMGEIPMEDQMLGMPPPPEMLPPEAPTAPPEPMVDESGQVIDPASGAIIGIMDPETGEILPLPEPEPALV